MRFLLGAFLIFVSFSAVCCNDIKTQDGILRNVIIDGKEFYISNYKLDGIGATVLCDDFNLNLVTLDNPALTTSIYDYILQNIGDDGSGYWMGTRKLQTEFQWLSKATVMDWNNWADGEPNQEFIWDVCVYFHPVTGWYDLNCSGIYHYFMCETRV